MCDLYYNNYRIDYNNRLIVAALFLTKNESESEAESEAAETNMSD